MKVKIEAVGFTAKQELIDFIEEKAGKLYQFYDKIINIEATLNVENSDTKENKACGIRLIIPGNDLWASAQCKTFEEAAVQAVERWKNSWIRKRPKCSTKGRQANYLNN